MELPSLSGLTTNNNSIAFGSAFRFDLPPILCSKESQFPWGEWSSSMFFKLAFPQTESVHHCSGAGDRYSVPFFSEWHFWLTIGILGGCGCFWSSWLLSWCGNSAVWVMRAVEVQYSCSVFGKELPSYGYIPPIFNVIVLPFSLPFILQVRIILVQSLQRINLQCSAVRLRRRNQFSCLHTQSTLLPLLLLSGLLSAFHF